MSASYLRLTKSETRELAEREHRERSNLRFQRVDWRNEGSAFSGFVVIAALVALIVLLLR